MKFSLKPSVISIITFLLLWGTVAPSRADSPITSTNFAKAYQDIDLVEKAQRTGILDLEMAQYLSSQSTTIDIKAALINALSWKVKGKHNTKLYQYYLGLTYNQPIADIKPSQLNDDELFALGYLTVMDDYFNPKQALPYLQEAKQRQPKSYTVAIINALAEGQIALKSDWCQVWRITEKVANNSTLEQDLRPAAQDIILKYMGLYKDNCRK